MGYGRRAGGTALVIAAAAITFSGCQAPSGADTIAGSRSDASAPDIIGGSRSDASAPDAFRNRAPLPMCRDVVLGQGEEPGPDGLDCLKRGYADDGAELAVARPTVEGDMIVSHFRVAPHAPSLQIFHDATRDKFGSGKWEESVCPLPRGVDSIAACLGG
jgi:hypothetical protein